MSDVTFSNWNGGLDTRRSVLTSQPGVLLDIQDAFINQGAEIEKRKAFLNVSYAQGAAISGALVVGTVYTITSYQTGDDFTNVGAASNASFVTFTASGTTPTDWTHSSVLTHENSYGLEVVTNGLLVFGSGTDPGGWSNNVSYQQLVHPAVTDGATFVASKHTLTAVACSTSFGGAAWVAATYSDGNTFVFWNGVYIPAFRNGQVLYGWNTNQNIATQLANAISAGALTDFVIGAPTSSGTGYQFLVNSAPGQTFSLISTPAAANAGSGTLVSTLISNAVDPVVAVAAAASFSITGGSTAGVAVCTGIFVAATDPPGGTNLLSASIGFNGSAANMAQFIALNINTNTALNGAWSAVATGSQITIFDNASRGTTINGYFLKVVGTGDFCTDNIIFNFNSNATWAANDNVTSILYNTTGATTVEILGATLTYKDGGHPTETLLQFVGRLATKIITNAAGYTAFVLDGVSPTNTVNLVVSRLTTDSGTAVGTTGCALTYNSVAGSVANGLSGGTATTASTLSAVISPKTKNISQFNAGNVSFTVAVTGGVGTFTYAWSLVIIQGAHFIATISGANNQASVTVATVWRQSTGTQTSYVLTCVVTDQVGNTATDTANLVG